MQDLPSLQLPSLCCLHPGGKSESEMSGDPHVSRVASAGNRLLPSGFASLRILRVGAGGLWLWTSHELTVISSLTLYWLQPTVICGPVVRSHLVHLCKPQEATPMHQPQRQLAVSRYRHWARLHAWWPCVSPTPLVVMPCSLSLANSLVRAHCLDLCRLCRASRHLTF